VWNRVSHRVTRADGPERIAPEWWLYAEGSSRRTRDYYRVEDDAGRRYWLFRDGLHDRGDDASPTWFMHGLFA
jgi:protein ImuB